MRDGSIDAGLSILSAAKLPGRTFTQEEIAEVCACSQQYIHKLERSAIMKLQRKLRRAVKRQ